MGMPWSNDNRSMAYHTPDDTIDKVSKKQLNILLISLIILLFPKIKNSHK